jgi:molybdopterin-guanine dinucleotide biosynthesis protein A
LLIIVYKSINKTHIVCLAKTVCSKTYVHVSVLRTDEKKKGLKVLEYAVIILAGGFSTRFGQNKALLQLGGKPLILHVLDRVSSVVDERIIVVNTEEQKNQLQKVVKNKAEILLDEYKTQTPLAGAYTGFKHAKSEYALLLSCDTPFVNTDVARLLLECSINRSAAIPRWPEGYIEPLQAAYHTKPALTAAETALEQGNLNMSAMIANLRSVRYISTLVLQQLDLKLYTFFNINTQVDLKRAETLIKTIKP